MATFTVDFTDALLELRFSELHDTIELAERLLGEEVARFGKRVSEQVATMSEEQRKEFYEYMSDEYWQLHERSPNILRRALFLICYSDIEAYLNRMCRIAQQKLRLSLSLNELAGRGIKRARLYLAKVASVAFPADSEEWQRLTDYNKLRNVIAHAEGQLSESDRRGHLGQYIAHHPYLQLESDEDILVQEGFCEEVVETALRFFKRFPKDLRE